MHLRLLPPKSYRCRHDPPEWEVSDDSGAVVGWIAEHLIRTAVRPFYALTGVHPGTGERIELQLSADLDERLAKLARFLVEPDSFAQHFSIGTEARRDWDARRTAQPWELGTGEAGPSRVMVVTRPRYAPGMDQQSDESDIAEFDFALTAPIIERHNHIVDEASRILGESSRQVKDAGVWARPEFSPDRSIVTFRVAIDRPGELNFREWGFRVAHLLFDIRATLDNIMWTVVHDRPLGTLTPKQAERVYFPMTKRASDWEVFKRGPIGRVIRPTLFERLETVQPYQTENRALTSGLDILSRVHRNDKHREPLTLHLVPDAILPIPQLVRPNEVHWGEVWTQVGNLTRPIQEGAHLRTTKYVGPVLEELDDLPLAPVPVVVLDGESYDLQELIWDSQGALQRVIDTVCLGNTFRSDLWDADIAWRREGVAALNRSLADGTNEWEDRRFNRESPYRRVLEELGKEDPDFDSVFPIDV